MAFLAAENENRQLEDLPQAEFGRVLERFLFPVSTDLILENFESLTLRSLFFFLCFNAFSQLSLNADVFFCTRGLSILLFSFIDKLDFSCQ